MRISQTKYRKNKSGFTLAEILLTLTIIGVVAAMSVPSLINDTSSNSSVVALKKIYLTLSQIATPILAENGDFTSLTKSVLTSDDFANIFIPHLNVIKICGIANAKGAGCFPNINYKYLNGAVWGNINSSVVSGVSGTPYSTVLTNDGISYAFELYKADCSYSLSGTDISSLAYNTCGIIHVDVNGPIRGPAVVGRDLFMFYVTKKGIIPAGSFSQGYTAGWTGCSTSVFGGGCAAKVLSEGAINY